MCRTILMFWMLILLLSISCNQNDVKKINHNSSEAVKKENYLKTKNFNSIKNAENVIKNSFNDFVSEIEGMVSNLNYLDSNTCEITKQLNISYNNSLITYNNNLKKITCKINYNIYNKYLNEINRPIFTKPCNYKTNLTSVQLIERLSFKRAYLKLIKKKILNQLLLKQDFILVEKDSLLYEIDNLHFLKLKVATSLSKKAHSDFINNIKSIFLSLNNDTLSYSELKKIDDKYQEFFNTFHTSIIKIISMNDEKDFKNDLKEIEKSILASYQNSQNEDYYSSVPILKALLNLKMAKTLDFSVKIIDYLGNKHLGNTWDSSELNKGYR